MIEAVVVSNGVAGLEGSFASHDGVRYRFVPVTSPFRLDLAGVDLLVVPNGSDHVAMASVAGEVRAFLDAGGTLFCFDGWFTPWVPGNRWVHDNSKATRDIRYRVGTDRHGLFAGVDLEPFNFHHGISGWWACGWIDAAPGADVLLADTWGRPVMVLDEVSTAGRIVLTASGPLADAAGEDLDPGLLSLYRNLLPLAGGTAPRPPRDGVAAAPPPAAAPLLPAPAGQRIGLLFNGVWSQYAFATAPKYRDFYRLLYVHHLDYERLRHLDALVIPFQSNQGALAMRRDALYRFLADGRKIAVFGDSTPLWMDAQWEHRPVDNYWWVTDPLHPPISHTDHRHPVYEGLAPRHACWHIHGVYTRVPPRAAIVQSNELGEIITWQTEEHGGLLFASTLDPIVEHGIQQIRHLDHYCDRLTAWLCGATPAGRLEIDPRLYGELLPAELSAAGIA